jgi:hypothetical protein
MHSYLNGYGNHSVIAVCEASLAEETNETVEETRITITILCDSQTLYKQAPAFGICVPIF